MKIIAHIENDFKEKFGIPRQSGIAASMLSRIVFEKEYRSPEALRGIEGYSHLWIIWKFSEAEREDWSPTVRPPRLGGNKRMGVFATRSPFRPNPIGLSSVKLVGTEITERGTVLTVSGADLLDGTPIYDIKPYLAYTDSHPDAISGFSDAVKDYSLAVSIPNGLASRLTEGELETLREILKDDPRPAYKDDGERVYTFTFGSREISFRVEGGTLTVTDIRSKENAT